EINSRRPTCFPSSINVPGTKTGWFIVSRWARERPLSNIWPLTSFASLSAIAAFSSSRMDPLTFSYKESATDQVKFSTIPAEEFIRRFLQHVLPDHFVKVRYYGLLSPANRCLLEKARELLGPKPIDILTTTESQQDNQPSATLRCPACGSVLKLIQRLKPQPRWPP